MCDLGSREPSSFLSLFLLIFFILCMHFISFFISFLLLIWITHFIPIFVLLSIFLCFCLFPIFASFSLYLSLSLSPCLSFLIYFSPNLFSPRFSPIFWYGSQLPTKIHDSRFHTFYASLNIFTTMHFFLKVFFVRSCIKGVPTNTC